MMMSETKQVDKTHYEFTRYMNKERWTSVWHQLDEVIRLNPANTLEIGPGPGIFKQTAALFGLKVETLDLDPDLKPDHVGSATVLPFPDASFDVVCAFQMLEHLPYKTALQAFAEMARVSRRHIVISLPDAKPVWPYRFHMPKFGGRMLLFPRPGFTQQKHLFDGEHYWEINKRGYALDQVLGDLGNVCRLMNTYRVFENPYHRFLIFEKFSTENNT